MWRENKVTKYRTSAVFTTCHSKLGQPEVSHIITGRNQFITHNFKVNEKRNARKSLQSAPGGPRWLDSPISVILTLVSKRDRFFRPRRCSAPFFMTADQRGDIDRTRRFLPSHWVGSSSSSSASRSGAHRCTRQPRVDPGECATLCGSGGENGAERRRFRPASPRAFTVRTHAEIRAHAQQQQQQQQGRLRLDFPPHSSARLTCMRVRATIEAWSDTRSRAHSHTHTRAAAASFRLGREAARWQHESAGKNETLFFCSEDTEVKQFHIFRNWVDCDLDTWPLCWKLSHCLLE